jgi:hypothetical protein
LQAQCARVEAHPPVVGLVTCQARAVDAGCVVLVVAVRRLEFTYTADRHQDQ